MLNGGEQPPFGRFRHLERQLSQVQGGLVEHVDGLRLAGTKPKSQQVGQRSAGRQRDALPPRGVNETGVTRPAAGWVRARAFSTCLVRVLQGPGRDVGFLIREQMCGDQQIFVITEWPGSSCKHPRSRSRRSRSCSCAWPRW